MLRCRSFMNVTEVIKHFPICANSLIDWFYMELKFLFSPAGLIRWLFLEVFIRSHEWNETSCSISKTSDISFNCVVQYVTVETTYQNLDMLKHQCYEFQHLLCPYIDYLLCYWYLVNVDASFCRCEFKMTTTFIMNAALILPYVVE